MVRIAVDAMGGDHAPRNIVRGAVAAARQRRADQEIVLVGRSDAIEAELSRLDTRGLSLRIVHASQVVEMDDPPALSVMKKSDSSITRAIELLHQGEVGIDDPGFFFDVHRGLAGQTPSGISLRLDKRERINHFFHLRYIPIVIFDVLEIAKGITLLSFLDMDLELLVRFSFLRKGEY